jgi:hypothetical protein
MSRRTPAEDWRVHRLKCWPTYFREILLGHKHTEFRARDRDFQVGDILVLREYDPEKNEYSGRELQRRVTYLYAPHQAPTFVVMELEEVD